MILDTNALSALAQKDRSLVGKIKNARQIAVTLISLGEYQYGIARSRKRRELENWLRAFLSRAEILMPNLETATQYAAVRGELQQAGTPIPANDCWIAALIRQHRLPIVSRDRHFDLVQNVRRIEW